jgi:hypothetical protein
VHADEHFVLSQSPHSVVSVLHWLLSLEAQFDKHVSSLHEQAARHVTKDAHELWTADACESHDAQFIHAVA